MKARADRTYRRALPGRAKRYFGLSLERSRLWLADDHILHLRMTSFTETCKRFYFKDIQALVVCKTSAGKVVNVILGIVVAALTVVGLTAVSWPVGVTLCIIAGILGVLLVTNALLGPTCVCRLHTAVQAERLASLGRLRTARKTVVMIKSLIDAAQGRLTTDDLDVSSEEDTEIHASRRERSATTPQHDPASPPQLRYEPGYFHAAVFCVFLVLAVSIYIDIFFQHGTKNAVDMMVTAAGFVLVVVSLRRQHNSYLPPLIKAVTWTALVAMILSTIFEAGFGFVYMIVSPESWSDSYPTDVRFEGPVFFVYCSIKMAVFSAIGIAGLVSFYRYRAAASRSASSDNPEGEVQP